MNSEEITEENKLRNLVLRPNKATGLLELTRTGRKTVLGTAVSYSRMFTVSVNMASEDKVGLCIYGKSGKLLKRIKRPIEDKVIWVKGQEGFSFNKEETENPKIERIHADGKVIYERGMTYNHNIHYPEDLDNSESYKEDKVDFVGALILLFSDWKFWFFSVLGIVIGVYLAVK